MTIGCQAAFLKQDDGCSQPHAYAIRVANKVIPACRNEALPLSLVRVKTGTRMEEVFLVLHAQLASSRDSRAELRVETSQGMGLPPPGYPQLLNSSGAIT